MESNMRVSIAAGGVTRKTVVYVEGLLKRIGDKQ